VEHVAHVEFLERPSLHEPPLICAFRGWNDGGEAASVAARYMAERWSARKVAVLDPEEFYDFQVSRPTVRLDQGVSRVIEWPAGEFWAATVGGKDVLVFTAAEPNIRWKTFARSVIGAATELGSRMLVTLGAFLTDVPHSRPVPVVGSAVDEETAGRLGLSRSRYEGPTGIVGVLHDASNHAGLPSISIWAAVPHYLPAAPNPKAALALVLRVSEVLGIDVPVDPLRGAVSAWEHGVAQLVSESDELAEYVHRLEGASDDDEPEIQMADEPVPSGDAIAAELERYLREQGGGST
jgi:predicted ATP-grasp superfamily ATP-dependent carboligase